MTTPTKAVSVQTAGQAAIAHSSQWTNKEAALIASTIAPGLNENQLRLFAKVCERSNKDPFRKEIYAWVASGKLCLHIGIQGWRQDAINTGEYEGQIGPEWCGPDGKWLDVWLDEKPPSAARVGVRRKGFPEPLFAVCTWREFFKNTPTWKEMGAHMLGIRAEYHALQRAFADAYQDTITAIKDAGAQLVVGEDEMPPTLVEVTTGEIVDDSDADVEEQEEAPVEAEAVEPPPLFPSKLAAREAQR